MLNPFVSTWSTRYLVLALCKDWVCPQRTLSATHTLFTHSRPWIITGLQVPVAREHIKQTLSLLHMSPIFTCVQMSLIFPNPVYGEAQRCRLPWWKVESPPQSSQCFKEIQLWFAVLLFLRSLKGNSSLLNYMSPLEVIEQIFFFFPRLSVSFAPFGLGCSFSSSQPDCCLVPPVLIFLKDRHRLPCARRHDNSLFLLKFSCECKWVTSPPWFSAVSNFPYTAWEIHPNIFSYNMWLYNSQSLLICCLAFLQQKYTEFHMVYGIHLLHI